MIKNSFFGEVQDAVPDAPPFHVKHLWPQD
jgi:hypothetical protein